MLAKRTLLASKLVGKVVQLLNLPRALRHNGSGRGPLEEEFVGDCPRKELFLVVLRNLRVELAEDECLSL